MTPDMQITEAAVHKAVASMQAWHDNPSDDRYYHEAMRDALQAAFAEALVLVGYENLFHQSGKTSLSECPAHPDDGYSRTLYTIKETP